MKLRGAALLGTATAIALAGAGTANGAARGPVLRAAPSSPDQGTTLDMLKQQAMAESGVRTQRANRLDVTVDELAATDAPTANEHVMPDGSTMTGTTGAAGTGGMGGTAGMAMAAAEPAVVTGPRGLARNVGGSWDNYAFTIPNAPAAAGTAGSPGAIHTVQLSTGKVLVVAGSGNQWQNLQAGLFTTWLWSPGLADQTKAWQLIPTPYDMFCAGHSILANGNVLITGGTTAYPQYDAAGSLTRDWQGSNQAYVFDLATSSYVKTGSMGNARWYPTVVTTGDGNPVVVGGLDDQSDALGVVSHNTNTVEQYDPTSGAFAPLPSMDFTNTDPSQKTAPAGPNETRTFPYYPGLVLLDSGKLFYSGASNGNNGVAPGIWDYKTGAYTNAPPLPLPYRRNAAATVLLPPAQDQKVMVLGGGDHLLPATADTQIMDLKGSAVGTWTKGPDLSAAKMYVGAVVLPDYTVFETNGASQFREGGVRTAGIYNPATNAYSVMNSPTLDRLYHSSAFLRPDGRVITLGSQPVDGTSQMTISVYSPPYLFKGQRPAVSGGVATFDHSGTAKGPFTVTTGAGRTVAKASLLRPSATTHSTDPDQRLVDLTVRKNANGTYALTAPKNTNLLPVGKYMLFVTDSNGVPSVGKWVTVRASPAR